MGSGPALCPNKSGKADVTASSKGPHIRLAAASYIPLRQSAYDTLNIKIHM